AIVNGEGRVEADITGVLAQQPGADGVEGARPRQCASHDATMGAEYLRGDALHPALHLGCGAAREGEQQDAPWIGATDDEMRNPVRQGVGFAGTGARDDQEWR